MVTLDLKNPNQAKSSLRHNSIISSERQNGARTTMDHFSNEPAFLASSKSYMISEIHNNFVRKKKSLSPKKLRVNRLENQTQYGGNKMKMARQLIPKKSRNARLQSTEEAPSYSDENKLEPKLNDVSLRPNLKLNS